MNKRDIVEELVSLILMQEEELDKLRRLVTQLKQYIEVYEEFIEGIEE